MIVLVRAELEVRRVVLFMAVVVWNWHSAVFATAGRLASLMRPRDVEKLGCVELSSAMYGHMHQFGNSVKAKRFREVQRVVFTMSVWQQEGFAGSGMSVRN